MILYMMIYHLFLWQLPQSGGQLLQRVPMQERRGRFLSSLVKKKGFVLLCCSSEMYDICSMYPSRYICMTRTHVKDHLKWESHWSKKTSESAKSQLQIAGTHCWLLIFSWLMGALTRSFHNRKKRCRHFGFDCFHEFFLCDKKFRFTYLTYW